jgi:hypothetical protein
MARLRCRPRRTMYRKAAILLRIPIFVFLPCAFLHDISSVLWVRLDRKPVATQVTLAPKSEDRRRVIVPNLFLLGVVPNAHTNVVVAPIAVHILRTSAKQAMEGNSIPPNVEWQLKSSNEDALVDLPCSVSESVLASVRIQATVLIWIIVRWVVFVESYLSHQNRFQRYVLLSELTLHRCGRASTGQSSLRWST